MSRVVSVVTLVSLITDGCYPASLETSPDEIDEVVCQLVRLSFGGFGREQVQPAGGQYGLLWILVVLLPICYFVQEMVARLGIATGKGHAAMIYERFGKWWGHFSLFDTCW